MRALLSHSLRALIRAILAVTLCALGASPSPQLPLPLGSISDYGAVLDRHGRERIDARIEQIRDLSGINVYILASWENPLPDADAFASAVFAAWDLDTGHTALAVFLKTGRRWEVRIRTSTAVRSSHGPLEQRLESEIADLVAHRRIEEAMVAFLDGLARSIAPAHRAPETSGRASFSPLLVVLLFVTGVVALSWLIHLRVCPRCGRFLRVESHLRTGYGERRRVYYCHKCGYLRRPT